MIELRCISPNTIASLDVSEAALPSDSRARTPYNAFQLEFYKRLSDMGKLERKSYLEIEVDFDEEDDDDDDDDSDDDASCGRPDLYEDDFLEWQERLSAGERAILNRRYLAAAAVKCGQLWKAQSDDQKQLGESAAQN